MYVVGEWINNPNYFVTNSHDELVKHISSLGNVKRISQEG